MAEAVRANVWANDVHPPLYITLFPQVGRQRRMARGVPLSRPAGGPGGSPRGRRRAPIPCVWWPNVPATSGPAWIGPSNPTGSQRSYGSSIRTPSSCRGAVMWSDGSSVASSRWPRASSKASRSNRRGSIASRSHCPCRVQDELLGRPETSRSARVVRRLSDANNPQQWLPSSRYTGSARRSR